MRNFDPWEVRDPAATLAAVLSHRPPVDGDVLAALLPRADSPDQQLLDVIRVHHGDPPDQPEASDLLCDEASRLVGPRPRAGDRWAPPQHVLVTVVCRTGRVVPGPIELFWLAAWRYSNHLGDAFDGDVYLVTEHGWTGCLDQRAGFSPALVPGPRHLALLHGTDRGPAGPRRASHRRSSTGRTTWPRPLSS